MDARVEPNGLPAESLVTVLKTAGDPTRLHLLMLCRLCDLSVSELTWILDQSQPRVSRHLKLLCDAGLLERYTEGNWVIYRHAMSEAASQIGEALVAILDTAMDPTATYLERLDEVRAKRSERVQAFFSKNAEQWAELSRLQVSEREVETALHGVLGPGAIGSLLDLGTGTGRLLAILAGRAERAVGVDVNAEMLAVARQTLDRPDLRHVQVRQADIHSLPFRRGSFDLITAHQVLHYLDDPDRVVREAARVLAPGGRLVIADLLPHELEHLKTEQAHRRLGFDDREISAWFRTAGLEPGAAVKLTGRPLPVGVWSATKPSAENGE